MKKITYFDVEYANSKNKSLCQIGLLCENLLDGEPIFPEMDIYVNPEDGFDDFCVGVHGITASKVADSPTFPYVWSEVEKYFTNTVVIGHNVANADLDALVKNLRRYNLDIPNLYYICTLELAKEYIPRHAIENYSMSALCKYFDIDIDTEHNAFDDACANSDLFKTLVEEFSIDVESHVKKFIPHESLEFSSYISNPVLRKSISEFYGIVRGFSLDGIIEDSEIKFIVDWRKENFQYSQHIEVANIIAVIDRILEDRKITTEEIISLQSTIKEYLDIVSTSPVTLATQILSGIMKGITVDGNVSLHECNSLRQWLYDNIYLSGHYPFDKVIAVVENVLSDSKITTEESKYVTSVINQLLSPVDTLRTQINSVAGKNVCLSGNFSYGKGKADVEKYIIEHGGKIDSSVKKTTDILMVGNLECQAYSNGTYGTKVKKAMEYNEKGCNIQIIKESDYFNN